MEIEIEIEIEIPRTGIIPVDVTSLFYLSLCLCVLSIILWDLLHAMNHESRITPMLTFMSISISHIPYHRSSCYPHPHSSVPSHIYTLALRSVSTYPTVGAPCTYKQPVIQDGLDWNIPLMDI